MLRNGDKMTTDEFVGYVLLSAITVVLLVIAYEIYKGEE